jgi:hypothetical protein
MLSTESSGGNKRDMMSMQSNSTISERVCQRCGKDIGRVERVGRRDTCLHCGADLHCCLNCMFYDPAFNNHCREPQAERQVDKQAGNFCDYFSFRRGPRRAAAHTQKEGARARLDALFSKRK